jgi:tetratricopeptide (TPR) repeat protein
VVGHQYCRSSEWEKALSFFEKQRRERFLQLSTGDRVRLFAYLGVVYANLLQKEQSESAFEKALLLDPCATLPTLNSIAPQIRERFRAMRIEYLRACQMQQREEAERIERQKRLASAKKTRPKALVIPKMTPSKALGISIWVTTGVGSAALVAALTFGGLAWWDQVRQQEQPFTLQGTHDYLSYHRQAQERAWMANLLFGVAGALLFTGFALHLSRSLLAFPATPLSTKKPSATQSPTRPLSSLSPSPQSKVTPLIQGRTHEFSLH